MSPVELCERNKPGLFEKDEHNRPNTTMASLAKLPPAFRGDGTITAGNAPGLNTAAAAMIVAERNWAEKAGLEPIGRLVSYGIGAVEPGMFGLGPVPAVRQALQRAGWSVKDVDRVEINEAFAAIAIAVTRELGFAEDVVNVEGGAIAHGHPDRRHRRRSDDTAAALDGARWSEARGRHALHRRRTGNCARA